MFYCTNLSNYDDYQILSNCILCYLPTCVTKRMQIYLKTTFINEKCALAMYYANLIKAQVSQICEKYL